MMRKKYEIKKIWDKNKNKNENIKPNHLWFYSLIIKYYEQDTRN